MTLQTFLMPVVALVIWTLLIFLWLYATRIPAMTKAKIEPQQASNPRGDWRDSLPDRVNWVADNYNHLHEQTTIFYVLMFTIALMEKTSTFALGISWLYVALRVLHSLSQMIGNWVMLRFSLFFLSGLSLIILALCAVLTKVP